MSLTDNQRKYTKLILNETIKDIEYFVLKYCDIKKSRKKLDRNFSRSNHYDFKKDELKFTYIPKNDKYALQQLIEFVKLLEYLENNHLIHFISFKEDNLQFPIFHKTKKSRSISPFSQFFDIVNKYYGKEIIVLPGLKKLIERNFRTVDEHRNFKERWFRFGIQIATTAIAIGTLIFMFYDNRDEKDYFDKSLNNISTIKISDPIKLTEPIKIEIPKVIETDINKSIDSVIILNQPNLYILKSDTGNIR